MPRHEAVRPMTDGQRTDIITTLVQALPPLSFADAKNITAHKGDFIADIRTTFGKYSMEWTTNQKLVEWQSFYRVHFGLELSFASLQIPERREGFDRLIVVAQGVTIQQVFDKCAEKFGAWKYTDQNLDEAVPTNDRDASHGSYAIWVRDVVEADEQWKNKSANALSHIGVKGETLLERLLHELKYYLETGEHLDIVNVTLCYGSRHSVGRVPRVDWHDSGRLGVRWYDPGDEGDDLRCREVVSTAAAKAAV